MNPIFYQNPVPLSADLHRNWSIEPDTAVRLWCRKVDSDAGGECRAVDRAWCDAAESNQNIQFFTVVSIPFYPAATVVNALSGGGWTCMGFTLPSIQ